VDEFSVDHRTDEVHSEEVSFSSVAIPFAHDFERFDFCVNVFNDNALSRQITVKQFLLASQRMILLF